MKALPPRSSPWPGCWPTPPRSFRSSALTTRSISARPPEPRTCPLGAPIGTNSGLHRAESGCRRPHHRRFLHPAEGLLHPTPQPLPVVAPLRRSPHREVARYYLQRLQGQSRGELPLRYAPPPEELLHKARVDKRVAVVDPDHCQPQQRIAEVAEW